MRNLLRPFVLSCSLMACTVSQAAINAWTGTGPQGGPVKSAAFHPSEPASALVGSARGVHLTLTGGAFWARMFDGDINDISDIQFDASRPQRVYALGNELHRSDDDARTFGAGIGPVPNLFSMALARDGVLYVIDIEGRLYRSANAGDQWTLRTTPWPAGKYGPIAVDPSHSGVVYACITGIGTFSSGDAGATWSGPQAGSACSRDPIDVAVRMAVNPADGLHVLVATTNGLMSTRDGGATWTSALAGQEYVWVGFDPGAGGGITALSRYAQIVRSADGGATWPTNLRPPRLPVHEAYGMAVSPTTAGTLLVATSEGPMLSTDDGATFTLQVTNLVTGIPVALAAANDGSVFGALRFPSGIFTHSGPSWYPVNNSPLLDSGPGASTLRSIAVAASDSSRVFAIDMGRRLMRSVDAGATWTGPHPQFATGPGAMVEVVIDPTDAQKVFLSESSQGLWRSVDGGVTWQPYGTGLPTFVGHIAICVSDPRVMYASGLVTPTRYAVYRSTDAGLTWNATAALADAEIRDLVVDPTRPGVVYVVQSSSISKSTDGGATWMALDLGFPASGAFPGPSLLVDPVHPDTLVAGTNYPSHGFLRSVDGGAHWTHTAFPLPGGARTGLGLMTFNRQYPGLVTAAEDYGGFYDYQVAPDLALSLTGLDAPVALGQDVTARIVITNHGVHAASAAHVTMRFPDLLTTTAPAGCALVVDTVACDVGPILVGGRREIPVTVHVNTTAGFAFIRGDLTSYEPDALGGDNVFSATIVSEAQSDRSVTLGAVPGVKTSQSTTFTGSVRNVGPNTSTFTHLEVALPAGVFALSMTASQGTCAPEGSAITTFKCELGDLAAAATITFTAQVRGDLPATHTINASVTGLSADTVTANNAASTTFSVKGDPPESEDRPVHGGGRFEWMTLLVLAAALWVRRPPRQVASPRS